MGEIRTKPPSEAYDEGYERIFGRGRKPTHVDLLADALVQAWKGEPRTLRAEDCDLSDIEWVRNHPDTEWDQE